MRFRTGLILTAGLAATAIAVFVAVDTESTRRSASRAFNYGQEDVTRFLGEHGVKVDVADSLARNPSGTKLYVFLFPDEKGQNRMAKITSEGVEVVSFPGKRAFLGSDGSFIAWLSQEGGKRINFTNGQSITLGRFTGFDVDPSGKYFVMSDRPESTWIGRAESPQLRVKLSKSFVGYNIFAKGKTVYVSGLAVSRSASGQVVRVASCLVLEDKGEDFKIVSQHDFDWSFGVEDVDPYSDRLLLCTKSDVFSAVYVYDLSTGKRHRVGGRKDFQLFLARDLLAEDKK